MINNYTSGSRYKSNVSIFILYLIAVSIGLNNIVVGFKLAAISVDRWLQILIFLIFLKYFMKDLKDDSLRMVQIFIGSLFFLITFKYLSILLQGDDVSSYTRFFRDIVRVGMYGLFLQLVYHILKKDLNTINVILFIMFLAFLMAFFQNPLTPYTDLSQHARLDYFSRNMKEIDLFIYKAFLDNINTKFMRVSGPYGQTITLSYSLVASSILTAYMYFKTSKGIYLLLEFFIFVVAIMTLTRSAVLAILIMLFYLLQKNKFLLFFLLLLFIVFYINAEQMGLFENLSLFSRVVSADESSNGKIWVALTGIVTLLLHPFGVTSSNYSDTKEWMYTLFHNRDILHFPSHNGLINLGFEYTTLVYIPFTFLAIYLVKKSRSLPREDRKFWFYAALSYFIQQSFHNNGIFYVDFSILIVLALFLKELKFSNKNNFSLGGIE